MTLLDAEDSNPSSSVTGWSKLIFFFLVQYLNFQYSDLSTAFKLYFDIGFNWLFLGILKSQPFRGSPLCFQDSGFQPLEGLLGSSEGQCLRRMAYDIDLNALFNFLASRDAKSLRKQVEKLVERWNQH